MKKLALITGINYQGSQYELGGCINDAGEILQAMVQKFGFDQSNIQLLIEEVATKKNILEGLQYLVTQLEPGDVGVFTYSGHGTQTADLPPIDEDDMLDEAIVPIDALDDQSNLIRDDEFHEILSNLANDVKFVVIFDSCHSGDGTKFFSSPVARTVDDIKNLFNSPRGVSVNRNIKRRCLPPSSTVEDINTIMGNLKTTKKDLLGQPLAGPNHILLSGCKADQVSFDNGKNGYFTRALIDSMQNGMTYQELYDSARQKVLDSSGQAQDPQLEGPGFLINSSIFE